MLKIHKPFSKHKLLLIPITSICIISGLLGFYCLTYTPELSHAETVVSPEPKPDLSTITYMQDITPEICANTKETDADGNYQYRLIDKRDSKTYWVAKLKDNNCWMTQNLDLDLSKSRALTSEDSDVIEDWTPGYTTQSSASGWGSTHANQKSYNPGNYYYTAVNVRNNCSDITGLSSCTSKGWKSNANNSDISGMNWIDIDDSWVPTYDINFIATVDYAGIDGQSICSKDAGSWIGDANEPQCRMYYFLYPDLKEHYHVGNYYSYITATAGTAPDVSGDAPSSICPKGWGLPKGGKDGDFSNIFDGMTGNTVTVSPYYLVYAGYVSLNSLQSAGYSGNLWSNTAANANSALSMYFGAGIGLNNGSTRYDGVSVRCMTSGGEKAINNNVQIVINPTISLDVMDEVVAEKTETNPSTTDLDVKVISNQSYTIGISTTNPNLTSSTNNVTIPAKSGLLNTAENGWGIKLKDDTEFTALTSDLQTFYTASGAEIKTIPFTIGISTAPDIPNGEYSTDITITATQN